ncbi:MAG: WG repeat-containing protein [Prevotella sp.]|nr:WG repeat-containing protein [Prevotella sp.]
MRKILFIISLFTFTAASAQVAKWVIHPSYEHIRMLGDGYYIVSQGDKYGILDATEKEIVPLQYDSISPFNSHMGLLFNEGKCIGYTSDKGEIHEFTAHQYKLGSMSRFSDGYLAVHNSTGYWYVRAEDGSAIGPYAYASPFCEGYAWVRVPKSLKHVLDGGYTYDVIDAKTGQSAELNLGEEYDKEDIDFISASSNGTCIIVLKKRFFIYDYRKGTLTPMSTDNNPENKKTRVTANERPVKVNTEEKGYSITCKQGVMTFDHLMRLTGIGYTGQPSRRIDVPREKQPDPKSTIKAIVYNGTQLLGLQCEGKEVLPAQFDDVTKVWGNEALVKQKGKFGVVSIDPNVSCRFVLNEGLDIGFEHKTAKSNIKVICPPYMTLSLMTLTSAEDNCRINIDTRRENVNVETAVLSYETTFNIPEDIGLEPTPSTIKFSLNYDGLKFAPAIIPYNKWYINNYEAKMLSHQIVGSVLTAEIVIRNTGQRDGMNYFRDVNIEAEDSVVCSFSKMTEESYTARMFGWTHPTVRFNVDITEDGCPTISYPFEVSVRGGSSSTKENEKENGEDKKPSVVNATGKVKKKAKSKSQPKKEEKKLLFVPK